MAATRIPVTVQTSAPVGTTNPGVTTGRSVAPPNVRTLGPFQPRLQYRDFASNRAQRAVQQALAGVGARYDSRQQVIPGVAFAATTALTVAHRLWRPFVGVTLVNPRGGYLSYQVAGNGDARLDALQCIITCLNDVTADVIIW